MSWITVDTKLGKHPKMAALPSDVARWGWLLTLLEAKEQRKPGTFASAEHFRLVMDRYAKFLPDYIKAKLLDQAEDGTLQVHDWRRHQWAGTKAQQRETLDGHSEDIDETEVGPDEDASRAVPVPVYVGSSNGEGVQGEGAVFQAVAKAGAFVRPESGMGQRLIKLVARRGTEAVLAELAKMVAAGGQMSDRQIVFGLEERLDPLRPPKTEARPVEEGPSHGDRIFQRMQARRVEFYRNSGEWLEEWGPIPEGVTA